MEKNDYKHILFTTLGTLIIVLIDSFWRVLYNLEKIAYSNIVVLGLIIYIFSKIHEVNE